MTDVRDTTCAPTMWFTLEHWRDGEIIHTETVENLVVNTGKNLLLDVMFGATAKPTWYMGLKGAGTPVVADTLSSHATWSELNPYTGNRPTQTFAAASGQAISATGTSFAITSTATVAGAFLATVNTGTSGVLYNAADFAASRSVLSGDTLVVTPTLSVT